MRTNLIFSPIGHPWAADRCPLLQKKNDPLPRIVVQTLFCFSCPPGFEPGTSWFVAMHSIQLSYGQMSLGCFTRGLCILPQRQRVSAELWRCVNSQAPIIQVLPDWTSRMSRIYTKSNEMLSAVNPSKYKALPQIGEPGCEELSNLTFQPLHSVLDCRIMQTSAMRGSWRSHQYDG